MEPDLPVGQMYLHLVCRSCGAKKRLVVPAHPMKVGSVLPVQGWGGTKASCIRCRKAQLVVQNTVSEPPPPPGPPGFRGMREGGDQERE